MSAQGDPATGFSGRRGLTSWENTHKTDCTSLLVVFSGICLAGSQSSIQAQSRLIVLRSGCAIGSNLEMVLHPSSRERVQDAKEPRELLLRFLPARGNG